MPRGRQGHQRFRGRSQLDLSGEWNLHCQVPEELLREAEEKAKAAILAAMDYD